MKSIDEHHLLHLATYSVIFLIIAAGLALTLSSCTHPDELKTATSTKASPTLMIGNPTKTPEPEPGLVIFGTVLDSTGAGVENVQIYRNYAAYPGEVIATTDANGHYISAFYPIPGDEMVAVWAEKPGLVFKPENYSWRHYYGYEKKECNFQVELP
jgi:hypothetical protein